MDSLRNLCRFASEITLDQLPREIVDRSRLVLLDTLGVIVGGSSSPEASRLAGRIGDCGRGEASLLGRFLKTGACEAALLNGIAGSSLEFEEGNSRAFGHPAIQLVPSILAQSEKIHAPGKEVLAGLIAGYESACRLSRASSLRPGLHPNGTWGTVGAGLGTGRICRKSGEDLLGVANVAASFAITPYVKNSFAGWNVASVFAGVSNHFGVLSNILYDSGFRADGASLAMTFSRFVSERFQEEALDEGLGRVFYIGENYFKPYPSCRYTHSPLDAMKAIVDRETFSADQVEAITVGTFRAAAHGGSKTPVNMDSARFSTPFLLAVLIRYGNLTPEIMRIASVEDSMLKQLASKVDLEVVPEYERLRPRENPTRVTVRLKDGRLVSHEVANARGEGRLAFGEAEVSEKFRSLVTPVIGEERTRAFLKAWAGVEDVEDISSLVRLLCLDTGAEGTR